MADYAQSNNLDMNEDVVVYLLSDVIDIDSKMVTFLKSDIAEKQKIYDLLYKADPTR